MRMRMRWLIVWVFVVVCAGLCVADELPVGSAPAALEFPHFPDRVHAFVWRNWEMVSLERMAEVLGTTPENVNEIGRSMGLPEHVTPPAEYRQRGYISIIRRNWHLLPYDQLLTLLGWDAEKLAFTLREDDFLWIKLGSLKPACPPLQYTEPNEAVKQRCDEIKTLVEREFGDDFAKPARPRFDFLRDMETVDSQNPRIVSPRDGDEPNSLPVFLLRCLRRPTAQSRARSVSRCTASTTFRVRRQWRLAARGPAPIGAEFDLPGVWPGGRAALGYA